MLLAPTFKIKSQIMNLHTISYSGPNHITFLLNYGTYILVSLSQSTSILSSLSYNPATRASLIKIMTDNLTSLCRPYGPHCIQSEYTQMYLMVFVTFNAFNDVQCLHDWPLVIYGLTFYYFLQFCAVPW